MSLQTRLVALQRRGRLPSVVGAVLRGGEVADSAGVRADPATAYRIGSITKTLTAVLVLQLRDEGVLSLDDRLGDHLPVRGYADVVLADLLGHTGGMQSEPAGPWWERTDGGDLDALLAAHDGSGAVVGPGDEPFYHYSNLGYGLLGGVVERHRGAPWREVAQERLLDPLGMDRTTWGPVAPHAQGHSVEHFTGRLAEEPHTDTGAMGPAGQLWSTVGDLATWAAFLAGRHPRGADLLARATLAEMREPRLDPGYGLGLRRVEAGGTTYVGHTGSMPGFVASLFVDPATGDGAVVLADATTGLLADGVPAALLTGPEPGPAEPWEPTTAVPAVAEPLLGLWFWGHTAQDWRWQDGRLEVRGLQTGAFQHAFTVGPDGRLVGVEGYHRGETLHVHPTHLECATFVWTRVPHDPAAPIPGG
ncbi:serine hydrolase domain-containing protein [Nocardioides litoris]|uniref:serine hydrolase domain-containing protein n=1 Tax=Nocardioides litoris TaxID=1926648 RepID=UPI0011210F64|nr:serine hydrolase domain-containing protein [Nocardioides litoris]